MEHPNEPFLIINFYLINKELTHVYSQLFLITLYVIFSGYACLRRRLSFSNRKIYCFKNRDVYLNTCIVYRSGFSKVSRDKTPLDRIEPMSPTGNHSIILRALRPNQPRAISHQCKVHLSFRSSEADI